MTKINHFPATFLTDEPAGTQLYSTPDGKYYRVKIDMVEGKHVITEIAKPQS